jgi:ferric-dicitrate binding protein FerR (iron transport regulator)
MEKNSRTEMLVKKILSSEASLVEAAEFKQWLNESEDNRIEFAIQKASWLSKNKHQYNLEVARKAVGNKIYNLEEKTSKKSIPLIYKIAATLIIPLIVFALYEVKVSNNIVVEKRVHASLGEQKDVVLPDGSRVKLNCGSEIIYPQKFGDKRDVRLVGEAFFEVQKDKTRPFVVSLGDVNIKVLGTSFNVSNYKNEDKYEIYLKTGMIELQNSKNEKSLCRLRPKQVALFHKDSKRLVLEDVNSEKYIAWTKGVLEFDEDKLSDVIKDLSRWYNVEIKTETNKQYNSNFTATFRGNKLTEVLDVINYTSNLKYTEKKNKHENGKKVIILSEE